MVLPKPLIILLQFALALVAITTHGAPIRISQANRHYLEWNDHPIVIVSSSEHYGIVLNKGLDYTKYLTTLARDGMNYTRVFTGSYLEKPGAFGIQRNTLAPLPGDFLAPWARSAEPGYAGGGNKFDLARWDDAYFTRLKDFIRDAARRRIVVEVTLFSSIYSTEQWSVNVFNPSNNVNGLTFEDFSRVHTLENGAILVNQERLVRKLTQELNGFENVIYEIQNEPWADNHTMGEFINPYLQKDYKFPNAVEITKPNSIAWQNRVAQWIRDSEKALPARHLISQNVANFKLPLRDEDLLIGADLVNFHYASPEAVEWNYGANRPIGCNETGFRGNADGGYRQEAWAFIMSGGGLFNHLDYSFSPGHEDGTDAGPNGPGGGSLGLRRQLKILGDFIRSFDFVNLKPDAACVKRAPGAVVYALSQPGQAYGVYLRGRAPVDLEMEIPGGNYGVDWISVQSGSIMARSSIKHRGGSLRLVSPKFDGEVALRVLRM